MAKLFCHPPNMKIRLFSSADLRFAYPLYYIWVFSQ